jgi:hypothetical protein
MRHGPQPIEISQHEENRRCQAASPFALAQHQSTLLPRSSFSEDKMDALASKTMAEAPLAKPMGKPLADAPLAKPKPLANPLAKPVAEAPLAQAPFAKPLVTMARIGGPLAKALVSMARIGSMMEPMAPPKAPIGPTHLLQRPVSAMMTKAERVPAMKSSNAPEKQARLLP